MHRNAKLAAALTVVVLATGVGWVGGRRIKSPAEAAAKRAAPAPSAIVVPVEKRTLSSDIVVRGTVRYGAPQTVNLAVSLLKKGSNIVTSAPVKGREVREGDVVMAVSGRPVFVLQGDRPTYRDLAPGASGPDVEQLERALQRLGLDPGPIDGIYDEKTSAAVSAWYVRSGWAPFEPTEEQRLTQRTAQADAFTAQSDLLKEREALHTAQASLTVAYQRAKRAAIAQETATATDATVAAKVAHDRLVAAADLIARQGAFDNAVDSQTVAQARLDEANNNIPTTPTPAERAALEAAVRSAARAVSTARADLKAAQDGAASIVNPPPSAAAREAAIEVEAAAAEVANAQSAVDLAQRRVNLFDSRASSAPSSTKLGIEVPADEMLFFPLLPLRIGTANAIVGEPLAGPAMTVTNSRLAVDSTLSLGDARLVKTGAAVAISETDLGIKAKGVVSKVADTPGTDGADPQRFHLEITPSDAPASLVGASVVVSITVGTTQGEVLAVPVAALSVNSVGQSRVQVQNSDRSTRYVTINPGLTAGGLVAVVPIEGNLNPGDLVVVGVDQKVSLASPTTTGGK